MNLISTSIALIFLFILSIPSYVLASHFDIRVTDTREFGLVSFFDLRDRESFIQITNTNDVNETGDDDDDDDDDFQPGNDVVVHVQIFNVDDNCNENNFYDTYTPNDTHTYNMRDIQTNDGNPSGVVLPEGAYGIIVIYAVEGVGEEIVEDDILIGNMRILDNNGYEYRTNSISLDGHEQQDQADTFFTFNFNSNSGITHSDILAFSLAGLNASGDSTFSFTNVVEFSTALRDAYISFDVNILDNNENIFSCRNVIFACTDQDNPLLSDLLEFAAEDGTNGANAAANVASFEYGINEAIPHSKDGELLCPGNNISEGFVQLQYNETTTSNNGGPAYLFLNGLVGLNNGNGRGSIDGWWGKNCDAEDECDG